MAESGSSPAPSSASSPSRSAAGRSPRISVAQHCSERAQARKTGLRVRIEASTAASSRIDASPSLPWAIWAKAWVVRISVGR